MFIQKLNIHISQVLILFVYDFALVIVQRKYRVWVFTKRRNQLTAPAERMCIESSRSKFSRIYIANGALPMYHFNLTPIIIPDAPHRSLNDLLLIAKTTSEHNQTPQNHHTPLIAYKQIDSLCLNLYIYGNIVYCVSVYIALGIYIYIYRLIHQYVYFG